MKNQLKNRRSGRSGSLSLILWLSCLLTILLLAAPAQAQAADRVVQTTTSSFTLPRTQRRQLQAKKVSERYYTQLSTKAKKVYNTLAATNLRKKKATWKVNTSFTTTASVARNGNALAKTSKVQALTLAAEYGIYAYRLDNMDTAYWMSDLSVEVLWKAKLYSSGKAKVTITGIRMTPIKSYSRVLTEDKAVNTALSKIVSYVKKNRASSSRYDTLYAMVQYMTKTIHYGRASQMTSYTPAGVLLKKYGNTGVCEAYAKTFFILCKKFKIPVIYVESATHAYNYVKMDDGNWYGMDTTWVDDDAASDPSRMDMVWFLYGFQEAFNNDIDNAHTTELYRYDARLEAITISEYSYAKAG